MPSRSLRCAAPLIILLPAVALGELQVSGLGDDAARNVRAYVALAEEPCDAEPWLVRRRFRNAETQARRALEPLGFYQPTIRSTLEFDERCWKASLEIDPGDQILLRNVDIRIDGEAASDPEFADLLQPRSLEPGTALRHAAYDRVKRAIQARAADRGYVEARFVESALDIWPKDDAADVRLHFESGPRYAFGEVIQDQDFLHPALVAGYLDFSSDMPYDSQQLTQAYRDLSNSGYFSRVEIMPDLRSARDGRIPVEVQLEPGNRYEYTIGAGVSTDTGPRLRAGYRNNRLNARGRKLKADLGLSPVLARTDRLSTGFRCEILAPSGSATQPRYRVKITTPLSAISLESVGAARSN